MEGAASITQQGATEWEQCMAIRASALTVIIPAVTAAAKREAAAACEACEAEDVIAKNEADARVLEEPPAQERGRKETENKSHREALAKDQAEPATREAN